MKKMFHDHEKSSSHGEEETFTPVARKFLHKSLNPLPPRDAKYTKITPVKK
jgi:hypothetical protein